MEKTLKQIFNENYNGSYIQFREKDVNLEILKTLKNNKETLSLGCGGGREVKFLVSIGHNVTAVDFSKNLIIQSMNIEPRAEYFCMDAIEFANENNGDKKFDCILGLFSFFNYIDRDSRNDFIKNLFSMLKDDGELIFEVRMYNQRWQDVIKSLLAPFYSIRYGKTYQFGDIYSVVNGDFSVSHHYTKRQLKNIFKEYDVVIDGSVVRVSPNLNITQSKEKDQ